MSKAGTRYPRLLRGIIKWLPVTDDQFNPPYGYILHQRQSLKSNDVAPVLSAERLNRGKGRLSNCLVRIRISHAQTIDTGFRLPAPP